MASSEDEFDSVEYALDTNEDSTVITLTLTSTRGMDTYDFWEALNYYCNELRKAEKLRSDPKTKIQ